MNRASKLAVSFFATLILIIFSPLASQAASSITPEQALGPAGSAQTVCGKVVSANYLPQHAKAPTFLNLNQPYPNQIFTALIWGENRSKFHQPEVEMANKL